MFLFLAWLCFDVYLFCSGWSESTRREEVKKGKEKQQLRRRRRRLKKRALFDIFHRLTNTNTWLELMKNRNVSNFEIPFSLSNTNITTTTSASTNDTHNKWTIMKNTEWEPITRIHNLLPLNEQGKEKEQEQEATNIESNNNNTNNRRKKSLINVLVVRACSLASNFLFSFINV